MSELARLLDKGILILMNDHGALDPITKRLTAKITLKNTERN